MTVKDPAPLESHLGYLLRRVSNHVSAAFARDLAEQGVSVAEWVALRCLFDHTSLTPSVLAEAIGMTQGAVTKIADKLLSKGWIEIHDNEADRRSRHIQLSKAGRKFVPELALIADRNDERFFGVLTQKETDSLRTLMNRLSESHNWNDIPKS